MYLENVACGVVFWLPFLVGGIKLFRRIDVGWHWIHTLMELTLVVTEVLLQQLLVRIRYIVVLNAV